MKKIWFILLAMLFLLLVFFSRQNDTQANLDKSMPCIVIDAGHGGYDPGKVSADGIVEKDINLQIAKKLKEELEQQGILVVMTRTSDKGLYEEGSTARKSEDMKKRCEIIERTKPVCTISIHQNSYTDASCAGPQVFYYRTSEEGKMLAEQLQKSLNEQLQIAKPRAEKEDTTYYILKRSSSVTVLVECGFLSNPAEAQLLTDEAYQQKVAKAISDGAVQYLETLNKAC